MAQICNGCEPVKQKATEIKVPFAACESSLARSERANKRLWIVILVLIGALLVSNLSWLIYESQFETVSYEQDGNGINNVNFGDQGDLNNGTTSENQTEKEKECEENPNKEEKITKILDFETFM